MNQKVTWHENKRKHELDTFIDIYIHFISNGSRSEPFCDTLLFIIVLWLGILTSIDDKMQGKRMTVIMKKKKERSDNVSARTVRS